MPTKVRNKGKVSAKSHSAPAKKAATSDPPAPFSRAPSQLEPLLPLLSTNHIYITSIDAKPWQFKAKIFAVPLIMNTVIITLLLLRLVVIGQYYLLILSSMLGYPNETSMNPNLMTWSQISYEALRRAVNFLTDLMLYLFVLPWPKDFFLGQKHGSPVFWRSSVGFKDKEIIVRRSRRWDENIGDVITEDNEGSKVFLRNVRQATSRAWMHDRTGYSMLDRSWDLDWALMILSTHMVSQKEMSLDDFKTTVLMHNEEFGWVVFETQDASGSLREEEGRKKIMAFKDELTAIGKENLFFSWIELIQYESSQPGGFGQERQVEAMKKAKGLFEAQGVDFDQFWKKIGGMEGMPGMDL